MESHQTAAAEEEDQLIPRGSGEGVTKFREKGVFDGRPAARNKTLRGGGRHIFRGGNGDRVKRCLPNETARSFKGKKIRERRFFMHETRIRSSNADALRSYFEQAKSQRLG